MVSSNIKSGVTIFGVSGSLKANEIDSLLGKTFSCQETSSTTCNTYDSYIASITAGTSLSISAASTPVLVYIGWYGYTYSSSTSSSERAGYRYLWIPACNSMITIDGGSFRVSTSAPSSYTMGTYITCSNSSYGNLLLRGTGHSVYNGCEGSTYSTKVLSISGNTVTATFKYSSTSWTTSDSPSKTTIVMAVYY